MASTTTNPTTETAAAAPPWHAAFPAPKSEVVTITREEVLGMLKGQTGEVAGKDFVLVDLRRNDFEVRLFDARGLSELVIRLERTISRV